MNKYNLHLVSNASRNSCRKYTKFSFFLLHETSSSSMTAAFRMFLSRTSTSSKTATSNTSFISTKSQTFHPIFRAFTISLNGNVDKN
uniref:Candidate secreted effector n=1 Tax=Meloidogyne incognita TaxID=6306 RepID=A0A914KK99_MELIC